MRLPLVAIALAALLASAAPASAAPIYTFTLSDGSAAEVGSILSFSFDALDPGALTLVKKIDSLTPVISGAVAAGTSFSSASFAAYDGAVLPALRLWEYGLTDVLFTSQSLTGDLETTGLSSQAVAFTSGPAATPVPEPGASLMMILGGAIAAIAQRRRLSVLRSLVRVRSAF